ncbi:MAG: PAS domain S-box protein [Thermoanaerobaculaceae bacterium]|jgi:PAS domain S-box-containing protein|nr:PAS domain S-box protein [Thermoanaerobaculaceae bacterium]
MPGPAAPSWPGASGLPELLDQLHVGRFLTSLEGEILDANEAFLRLLGFSSLDEARACRTADIYARPEDRAAAIRRTLDEGTVNDQVLQLRRRDGSLLWVSVVEVASRLPDGRVVFTGILHETGERVAAAQELRASADRYERLVEQANVAIFLGDAATGRLLHANLHAQELIGRSLDEIRQMSQWELHPEPERTRYETIFREHAGTLRATQTEAEVVDRHGTRIPVQISASLVEIAGRPVVQGVFHDLRGLHQARQALEESAFRYRQLVELSPDAIAVHCEGRLVFVNATAARMLGADNPDELVGRPVIDFVHPDSRPVVRERVQRMLASRQAEPLLEERFLRVDGVPVEVEVAAGPFTYLGQPAIQVMFRDIAERKRLREELERSQAQQAAILAALPVAVYAAEVPGDLDATWMSTSVERFTGFPAERFMAEPHFWSARLHPDDRDETITSYRKELEAGEALVEYRWQVADGSFRWFSDHAVCVARSDPAMHVIGVITDISERRRAEQALRESEEKYRDLVEKIGEAIFTVDADGTLTFISAAARHIIGFEPAELVGRHFSRFIHPDDLPGLVESFERTIRGELHPSEYRVVHKSGGTRWVRSSSQPMLEGERPVGLRGVLIDITERRESELALQHYARRLESMHDIDLAILAARSVREIAAAALQRLRQLIPAERAAIVAFHPATGDGEYVAVDSVPGLGDADSGRTQVGHFLPGELERNRTLYLADLAASEMRSPAIDRLLRNGVRTMLISSFSIEENLVAQLVLSSRQADAFSAQDQDVAGEVAGVLGVVLHQARLRERIEEQQRNLAILIAQLPDGVVVLDHDARLVLANPVAVDHLALLGHDDLRAPLTHLAGTPVEQLLAPREGGIPFELHTGGSEPRLIEVRVRPAAGGPGRAWILLLHDATRERQLMRSLEQQDRLAVIGQLAGGLAHDFNNLLTAILTHAELLLRDPEQRPAARDALRVIKEQTERSAKLVRSILDFSRGSGSERSALDLNHFVSEVAAILARTIPERIGIEVDTDPGTSCPVHADATQLQQVIMNVAVNARDAIPGQGRFVLRVRPLDLGAADPPPVAGMLPGPWIHLALVDNGSGIRPEHLPHVFEPFFTTKAHGHGTGLGLSQVYGLVKQNDGWVLAESVWGRGTTIHVFLPAHRGAVVASQAPETDLAGGSGEVILLAEDETEVRLAIEQALDTLGYRVVAVENGLQALEFLQAGSRIDLLLTDLTMPVMSGEELIRATRVAFPDLRIVVLTGYAAGRTASLGELGIVVAAQKPLSLASLADVVRRALD